MIRKCGPAFDVYARVAGQEYHLFTMPGRKAVSSGTSSRGAGWGFSGRYDGPPVTSCDLILRSNQEVARRTVDLFEIWDGELVYENVPVAQK